MVDEQRFTLVSDTSTPMGAFGKVGFEGLRCWPAERNEAFFAPFAAHPNHPLTELNITEVEGHEFADAESCCVKKLHRRAVSAPRGGFGKSFKKFLDRVTFGNLRCSLDIVGVGHSICRARFEGALGHQEAKISPERGQGPRDGTRLETA